MMQPPLQQTIQLTQFMIEQIYHCDFSRIFPLLHPDITWIGLTDGQYLKGYNLVLSHFLRLCNTPAYRLASQRYEMVPLSDNTCIVTGYFVASTTLADGRTLASKQYITFVWQLLSQSFHAIHIQFSIPFRLKEKMLPNSSLLFRGKNGSNYLISPNDILYIEADNISCKFYTKEQCIDICQPINQIEQIMPEHFIRIHRSYIVNKNYVEQLKRYMITLKNGSSLPIPEKKYKQVKQAFQKKALAKP